jgi:hypothetical protein
MDLRATIFAGWGPVRRRSGIYLYLKHLGEIRRWVPVQCLFTPLHFGFRLWASVCHASLDRWQGRSTAAPFHYGTCRGPSKNKLRVHWNRQSCSAFRSEAVRSRGRNDLLAC